jgi:hypothetical protein
MKFETYLFGVTLITEMQQAGATLSNPAADT